MYKINTAENSEKISYIRKFALTFGDFGFNIYWQTVSIFLLFFYTDVLGISTTLAGLIYMVSLLIDACIDPVIGYLTDRTKSKFGKYRPYLIFGSVPLALVFIAMFVIPLVTTASIIYITFITHVIFRILYAIVAIPYTSLFARITKSSVERTDIAGMRMFYAMIASVFVSAITLPIVNIFGLKNNKEGWIFVSVLYAFIAVICLLITSYAAKNLDKNDAEIHIKHKTSDILKSITKNRPLHIAIICVLVTSFSATFFNKNMIYYFKYVIGDESEATTALTLMAVVTALSVPLWTWMARSQGKKASWMAGLGFTIVGLLSWWLADRDILLLRFALVFVAIGAAASYVSFWAIAPDTVEYGEWRSGIRTESLIFGLIVLGQKAALGVGAGALGASLRYIGYVANAEQSSSTLEGLRNMMVIVPMLGSVLAVVLLAYYKLDHATHLRITREIAEGTSLKI